MNTQDFIERAVSIHGNTYSYEKSVYVRPHQKLTITCPLHGDFDQSPSNHFAGKGCRKCGNRKIGQKLASGKERFIAAAIKQHSDFYSYDKVAYVNAKTDVMITCPIHGDFLQTPDAHVRGTRCPTCGRSAAGKKRRISLESFVDRSNAIHGNKYIYSLVELDGNAIKVKILCPEHGIFEQSPANHLSGRGCAKCVDIGSWNRFNAEQFISDARAIHGDRYDYSQVIYQNNSTPVEIICAEHGSFFQVPVTHIFNKAGCPACGINQRAALRTRTTEQFISDARAIHGDRYDYSQVIYTGINETVDIICPIHGKYTQAAHGHLAGHGCGTCRLIDRFYPSSKTCSVCGHIKHDLTLNDRRWRCSSCHTVVDRDANAAVNILREGASSLGLGDVRPAIVGNPCLTPESHVL